MGWRSNENSVGARVRRRLSRFGMRSGFRLRSRFGRRGWRRGWHRRFGDGSTGRSSIRFIVVRTKPVAITTRLVDFGNV